MKEETLNRLDEIVENIYDDKEITNEDADLLLEHTPIPKVLRELLKKERLFYIDLIENFALIDKLPPNPFDTGGKEHLAKSIQVANKLHSRIVLNEEERLHLFVELTAPLEFIFTGKDDPNLETVVDTLTRKVNEDAKQFFSEERISKLVGEDFKKMFFSIVETRSTDTFMNEVEKALVDLSVKETDTDETMALNFKGYPKKSLFHTTLISRDLPLLMEADEEDANQFFIKRRQNSNDIVGTLTFDDIMNQHDTLTPLDMVHYIGVCRLYDNGTRTFTPDMLVRATYADNKKTVTPKQREEAIKSVDKLMKTVIDIDLSEEYRAYRKIGKHEQLLLGENMLYARRAKLKHSNGSVSWGYELLQQPVLDVHAFNLGQIDRLDNELVETSGGKEDLLLTNYLSIRLASLMNQNNKISNVILLDTVYKHIDVSDPNRQKAAQIRRKIDSRLTEWKNRKVIKDFEFMKEGNKITKFKIVM